ncbi:NifB/NifX family molybdenum-iron cluster-binding protein [Nocardioides ferulae]|uniref:NifB/NifX family molybdenum-iron cluster-binding protein n=1 Tax=Nocardioides ferulae TaxID=2340821 RepID=UPI000EAC6A85|nr:NifB/NifX family molybdenum-iron cluster-binding protein [Nocardioides ferulae]
MNVCVTLGPDGTVGGGLGKAARVAVATVTDGELAAWTEHEVGWDRLHDEGTEGAHHARMVRFLREHHVELLVAGYLGAGMQHTLTKLGVRLALGAQGDAQEAVVRAATSG